MTTYTNRWWAQSNIEREYYQLYKGLKYLSVIVLWKMVKRFIRKEKMGAGARTSPHPINSQNARFVINWSGREITVTIISKNYS